MAGSVLEAARRIRAVAEKCVRQESDNAPELNKRLEAFFIQIVTNEAGKLGKNISSEAMLSKFRAEYVDYLTGVFNSSVENKVNAKIQELNAEFDAII